MKKKMLFLVSGCIAFSAFANHLQAQETSLALNQRTGISSFSRTKETTNALDPKDVNAAALSDFTTHYKDASTIIWTASGENLSVYFTDHDVKKRSTYNVKGKLEYTISYYNEASMPVSVRNVVASDYRNYHIIAVTEVKKGNQENYFVVLEDKMSILNVYVKNGETELISEVNKQ